MDVWQIIGPIIAVAISVVFTIVHTRRLRSQDRIDTYTTMYMKEVDEWTTQVINLCNRVKKTVTSGEWEDIVIKRDSLLNEGARLCTVKPCGEELQESISQATDFIKTLPRLERKWVDNEVEELETVVNTVKNIISTLRYEK